MVFQISKLDFISAIGLLVLVIVLILLQFVGGLPFNKPIDSTYVSGTLTATGILLGFLTASVISGRQLLRQVHFSLVEACFFLFIVAVVDITGAEVRGTLALSDYVLLQMALVFTGITAFVVVRRVSKVVRVQHAFATE